MGSRQTEAWWNLGFNFEALIARRTDIRKPITGYHGGQVGTIFRNRRMLMREMGPYFDNLRASDVQMFKELPDKLIAYWSLLSTVHQLLESYNPDLQKLRRTLSSLREVQEWFFNTSFKPFRVPERFYDHALHRHWAEQASFLQSSK